MRCSRGWPASASGRHDRAAAVPVPPVAACRAAGVTVIGGNDGVRDTWTPYGSPDMLERAMLIGMRNDFRRDDALEVALDCVTHGAARGCGFDGYGLQAGSRADVVLVDALTFAEAVVARRCGGSSCRRGRSSRATARWSE